jgi:hypothetical protein
LTGFNENSEKSMDITDEMNEIFSIYVDPQGN